jgi:hypothetical protein
MKYLEFTYEDCQRHNHFFYLISIGLKYFNTKKQHSILFSTFSFKLIIMRKSFLKLFTFILIAPAFLFSFTSLSEKANFSGYWKLNGSKSELGQFGDYATRVIKAEQKDESIIIDRTAASFTGGDFTSTETLTFDGKVSESNLAGSSTKKATLKWAEDGQTFTITFTLFLDFNGQSMEVTGSEIWTLSDGGKTLTSVSKSSSSFGDNTIKAVYEKQ